MRATIADLWLLTYDDLLPDIRGALFTSHEIEREVRRANDERRKGRTDWTALDLEEAIQEHSRRRDRIPPVYEASMPEQGLGPLDMQRRHG